MTPSSSTSRLAALALLLLASCGPSRGPDAEGTPTLESGVRFRARGGVFEIGGADGTGWRPFFLKGVNLGVAKPGRFPGELAATAADYARWLELVAGLGGNVVRLYTLHFPAFYEAFGAYNRAHPEHPIYLVQGIWLDELEGGDYVADGTAQLDEEIALVVDAVHGAATIPERRGKAWGAYRHDVSRFVLAWLPGHELDPALVASTNERWSRQRGDVAPLTRHDGRYVVAENGLPMEAWVARALDGIVTRELDRYGAQRPVGWSNWPPLDPLRHPTEPVSTGQDLVDLDLGRFLPRGAFDAGIFVSYHAYPYYPDFICYDPAYAATTADRPVPDSYLAYLVALREDLAANHPEVPLLVAEYGVPSSFGVAHVNATAFDHGGYSEAEQAEAVAALYRSVVRSGAAGAIAFELLDEWFKHTWLTRATTLPADRAPLWYDVLSPEESFGLVSFYPTPDSVAVDGDGADWAGRGASLHLQDAAPAAPVADGHDGARTLLGLHAAADPAFLFLRLDTGAAAGGDFEQVVLLLGVSTLPGATGDARFPGVDVTVPDGAGLEAVVTLDLRPTADAPAGLAELRIDEGYDPSAWLNAGEAGSAAAPNADGRYVPTSLVINTPAPYLREPGLPLVPEEQRYLPGLLRRGPSQVDGLRIGDATVDAAQTLAHLEVGPGVLELRLPWHALWVTDPSSRRVLCSSGWAPCPLPAAASGDERTASGFETRATPGVALYAVAAARDAGGALRVVDALPRGGFTCDEPAAGGGCARGRFEGGAPTYLWAGWDAVSSTERLKPAYHALREAHAAVP